MQCLNDRQTLLQQIKNNQVQFFIRAKCLQTSSNPNYLAGKS